MTLERLAETYEIDAAKYEEWAEAHRDSPYFKGLYDGKATAYAIVAQDLRNHIRGQKDPDAEALHRAAVNLEQIAKDIRAAR